MPQCLMYSINQSIRIHYEYPMTVLLKIVNNSMTALLDSLSVLLESINLQFILLFYKSGGLSPLLFKSGGAIAPYHLKASQYYV